MKKAIFSFPLAVLKSVQDFALSRRRDIQKKIQELDREDPFKDNERSMYNSLDDDAREQVDHERVEAIRKELELNLEETNNALAKIKKGKYGFCEKCGRLIDTARLEVNPLARYCLKCEEKNNK